ncbi:MAG: type II toxin-antitoxin system YafQ family toxin [Patescibacteria group bacterium]
MLVVHYTSSYKRSFKRYTRSGKFPLEKLTEVLNFLRGEKLLPNKYRDHQLKGKLVEFRECHIAPDILLIYKIEGNYLKLNNLGSHGETF